MIQTEYVRQAKHGNSEAFQTIISYEPIQKTIKRAVYYQWKHWSKSNKYITWDNIQAFAHTVIYELITGVSTQTGNKKSEQYKVKNIPDEFDNLNEYIRIRLKHRINDHIKYEMRTSNGDYYSKATMDLRKKDRLKKDMTEREHEELDQLHFNTYWLCERAGHIITINFNNEDSDNSVNGYREEIIL